VNYLIRVLDNNVLKFQGKTVSVQTLDSQQGILSILCFDLIYFLKKPRTDDYSSLLHSYKIRVKSFTQTSIDCEIYNESTDSWEDANWSSDLWKDRNFVINPKGRTQSEYSPESLNFVQNGYEQYATEGSVSSVENENDYAGMLSYYVKSATPNRESGYYLAMDFQFAISEAPTNIVALQFDCKTASRSSYHGETWWIYNFTNSEWEKKFTVPSTDFSARSNTLMIESNISDYVDASGHVKISIVSGDNLFCTQLWVYRVHLTVHTNGDLLIPKVYTCTGNDSNTLNDSNATFQDDNVAVEDEIYIMKVSGEIMKDLASNVANFNGAETNFLENWENNDFGNWGKDGYVAIDSNSYIEGTYCVMLDPANGDAYLSYSFNLQPIYKPHYLTFKIKRAQNHDDALRVEVEFTDGTSKIDQWIDYTAGGSTQDVSINLNYHSVKKIKFSILSSGVNIYIDSITLNASDSVYEGSQPLIIEAKGRSNFDLITQIAEIEGCKFWVEDTYLHYKKMFDDYGSLSEDYIQDFKQIKDASELCNFVKVVGFMNVSATASDDTSISNYGLYQRVFYLPEFRTEKECQDFADRYLATHKDIHNTCTFKSTKDINLARTLTIDSNQYFVESKKTFWRIGKETLTIFEYGCGSDPISFDPLSRLKYQSEQQRIKITQLEQRQLDMYSSYFDNIPMSVHGNDWHNPDFATQSDLNSHESDTSNPHSVTLDQAFDAGKEIDGADSEANAMVVSDGSVKLKNWSDGTRAIIGSDDMIQIQTDDKIRLAPSSGASRIDLYTTSGRAFVFGPGALQLYGGTGLDLFSQSGHVIVRTEAAGKNIYLQAGGYFYFDDHDASNTHRMYLDSANGNLYIDGSYNTFTRPLPSEDVLPLLLKIRNKDGSKLDKNSLPDSCKSEVEEERGDPDNPEIVKRTAVDNTALLMHLVKAVQELAQKVEDLENRTYKV